MAGANATLDPQTPPGPPAKLGWAFWMLCTMEGWERLAYYGLRVVVGIYIAQADAPGGLHWSQADRATIFAWWAVFQSWLPTFTGGLADRYGYKNTIFVSITLKVAGYLLMAVSREYWPFFCGAMLLATGTALFKPGIQGSLAQNLTKANGSVGWGIFYWLVNVGAMIGPPFAGWMRGYGWEFVFYGCAAIAALNYGMLFTYKEQPSGADPNKKLGSVLVDTFSNFFQPRLLLFLLCLSGFWLMMYQLWDFHPFFITDWVDSGPIIDTLPFLQAIGWTEETTRGVQIGQEHLLNLNAMLVVLLVIPISRAVAKLRTLTAMIGGMMIATCGILASGLTTSGWMLLLGIFFFSLGEMLTGPKKTEYLGYVAPPGKKALYLGYVNIPVGVGQMVGALLSAWLYSHWGEKAMLAQRYLAEHDTELLGRDITWNGDPLVLGEATGVSREEAFETLCTSMNLDGAAATELLWNTYDPWVVWLPIAAIGVSSVIGLYLFARAARKWADMNH
ncbi:MAG: MFS transporter [Myxococcota bacterium]|nr:MFS transporter [Myxococcota bacterium]